MTKTPSNQLLLSRTFSSFEELADLVRHWKTDFRQVYSPETGHTLLQVSMGGMLLSRARFGCYVQQRGETPPGSRTMALLTADCPPVYWFGRRVGPSDLLVFPIDGSIDSISRPGFSTHTFCVDMDDLAGYFECAGGPDLDGVLGDGPTAVRLAPSRLQTLRSHLNKVSFDPRELRQSLALFDAYRDRLFALLLAIFRDGIAATPRRDVLQRHRLVTDFVRLVEHHRDEVLSLPALSAQLGVPERTLSCVFRREVGMSPASFAKGYRLFGAHRALWQARSPRARVADIANAWGFWHMGQFAADYQKFFGELPKHTLKRLPSAR